MPRPGKKRAIRNFASFDHGEHGSPVAISTGSNHEEELRANNYHLFSLCTGAANIGDAGKKSTVRADKDVVPEAAVRPSSENTDYHVGRGGAGNAHIVPGSEKKPTNPDGGPISLADKLKSKIFGRFSKK